MINKFLFILILAAPAPALAAAPVAEAIENGRAAAVEHSGGCRKSSPPGQCCHAGSRPLHCH